jgi:hypothetical protein
VGFVPDVGDELPAGRAKCRPREAEIGRLADSQLRVISMAQLRELGFSYDQIRRRVETGRLHPWFRRVFSVGTRGLAPRAVLLAAQLSVGPRSFLSHRSAAAILGLRAINTHEVHLTVAGGSGRNQDVITVHRTRSPPHAHDLRIDGPFRFTSVTRTLIDLASRENPSELERLVTLAVRRRLLRPDTRDGRATLEEALARHARFPGITKLAAVLASYRRTEDHKSQLEAAFDRILAEHPDIPPPQRNIHLDIWEIDRYWPAHHLAVELDGRPYHAAVGDMERDRIKDAALQRLGVTPLRFTDFRVEHDVPGILGDVRHFTSAVD